MNAPRKPVAWMRREVTYRGVDGRTDGERVVSERQVMADDIPLYTDPNLQPLWALVEEWEAISKTHTSQLVREAHADFASELRATLEAMQ